MTPEMAALQEVHSVSLAVPLPTVTVLIVDDSPSFRDGIKRQLRIQRHEVQFFTFEASNETEIFAVLDHEKVDCVLLDLAMPGSNGLVCLKRITTTHANLPVIMLTGNGDEESAVRALQNGAMDYLVKGIVTPVALRRSILNNLDKVRMRLELEAQREALLENERNRVMIQSIGAACHHIGQPMTVLACCLEMVMRKNIDPDTSEMLRRAMISAEEVMKLLENMQHIATFRTVPYRPLQDGESARSDTEILDLSVAPK